MKYIIMADGSSKRWENFENCPKHLLSFNGENLLQRAVRLLKTIDPDCEIIITSHDPRYEVDGATRYEPQNNVLELDRFTAELIEDNICFMYGDTYYTEAAVDTIVSTSAEDVLFFGNRKSIVAIKIANSAIFSYHVERVRRLFLEHKIQNCKGWQVYQSYANLEFDVAQIGEGFVLIEDQTKDFNCPSDLLESFGTV